MSGLQDSQPVILKLGPDIDGLKREAAALKAFEGFDVVKVLVENEGMLLLERCTSSVSLKSLFPVKDNDAISITCECLKHLHKAPIPTGTFPHIKDWLTALDKDWKIPAYYLQKARRLRDSLLQTSAKEVLLHGDLHHDNILKNAEDWKVIDPKGVMGEPAFEVAAFIRNPISELPDLDTALPVIHNRIIRFAQILALPEQRILDWCVVQAVLAWVWTLEDGCNTDRFRQLTDLFERYPDVQF